MPWSLIIHFLQRLVQGSKPRTVLPMIFTEGLTFQIPWELHCMLWQPVQYSEVDWAKAEIFTLLWNWNTLNRSETWQAWDTFIQSTDTWMKVWSWKIKQSQQANLSVTLGSQTLDLTICTLILQWDHLSRPITLILCFTWSTTILEHQTFQPQTVNSSTQLIENLT